MNTIPSQPTPTDIQTWTTQETVRLANNISVDDVDNDGAPETIADFIVDPDGPSGIQKPRLAIPDEGSPTFYALAEILAQIGIELRRSALDTWGAQVNNMEEAGKAAAREAFKAGLTTGLASIFGGVAGLGGAGLGIYSLRPTTSTFTKVDGADFSGPIKLNDYKQQFDTLSTLRNDATGRSSKLQILSEGEPKNLDQKVEFFQPKIDPKTGQPTVHEIKIEVPSLKLRDPGPANKNGEVPFSEYFAKPITNKDGTNEVNHFRFEDNDGNVLALDKNTGEMRAFTPDELKAQNPALVTSDGNNRLYIGGEEVGDLNAEKLNIQSAQGFSLDTNTLTKGDNNSTQTVQFVEMQAMMNKKPISGYGGKDAVILYAKEPGGVPAGQREDYIHGVPKKVHTQSEDGGALSTVAQTEKYQTSQNWTQLGSALSSIITGGGTTGSAIFEENKIEYETDQQVSSLKAGEQTEFRQGFAALIQEVLTALSTAGDAEARTISSV